ncbi:Gfo/Idh/MocA family oxidoreductase [Maribacter sp. MAR_2009_72]|uniref:Gfo/Idh/MocA family oxidoreductase n=1 Tax=Maribacter sp. MAR_2009_72 TaxID=1250050 RepID=UPI00119C7441|nr:Gfo/Idh/MocA family oxidoreductase [Maribacter sp. MAR_2009_72]TVZ14929.1 secreted protein [Maribacter sp. MAR_2009_72]
MSTNKKDTRRNFIKKTSTAGLGLAFGAPSIFAYNPLTNSSLNNLNFGIIGFGGKGGHAYSICAPLTHIKFKAVCDINPVNRAKAKEVMGEKHDIQVYEDYEEMIDKEKLDAVIINTPDMWHARQSIHCMKKGVHVYCEKTMAFNQEEAKEMVRVMNETGMKLQIGHQRRSTTNYLEAFKMAHDSNLFGRLTNAVGQWNNSRYSRRAWKKQEIDDTKLAKYGYGSYDEYANWRCFKSVSNGIIADLGAHQIDIYSWFFKANPHRIMIAGSRDYYPLSYTDHEDNVFVIFDYKTPQGPARAFYEVIANSSALGVTERIIGDKGAVVLSLNSNKVALYKEDSADQQLWDSLVSNNTLKNMADQEKLNRTYVDETAPQITYKINVKEKYNAFTAHMLNFTEAIMGNESLNCDAAEAYRCELPVFKIAEALRKNEAIVIINESEYVVS